MTRGALGAVSALRETSVVFAAFIGRFWLGERLGPRRLAACLAIGAGVLCIAAAR
jgi:drug/metabolite transporter (DMT)-like permease